MSKARGPIRSRAELLVARALHAAMPYAPTGFAVASFRALGDVACLFGGSLRRAARDNVMATLGLSRREAGRIVRAAYRNVSLNLVESSGLGHRARFSIVDGEAHLLAARASDRGLVVCSGHVGSWAALVKFCSQRFDRPWLVVRRRANALLGQELERWTEGHLAGQIAKDDARSLKRVLDRGECVIALIDQYAGRKGAPIEFLGVPARQFTSPARLALGTGAGLLPAYVLRTERSLDYDVIIEPAIEPDASLPRTEAVLDVTRRLSASLERQVRRRPEQWNWIHDRWHGAVLGRQPGRALASSAS